MDIGKGKVNKAVKGVFDRIFNRSNTYIPAMHENKPDTFERSVSQESGNIPQTKQKPQSPIVEEKKF